MSKRTVERELETLGDSLLSELSADDRLALFLEAAAADNEHAIKQLADTCPRTMSLGIDLQFVMGGYHAKTLADLVVYELQTTQLQFSYLETVHSYEIYLGLDCDAPAATARRKRGADRAEALYTLYAQLYGDHQAAQRFADDVLEVDVHAWLGLHHTGPEVFDQVTECLDANEASWGSPVSDWMAEILIETDEGWERPDPPDKDRLAEVRFEDLALLWDDLCAPADPDGPV